MLQPSDCTLGGAFRYAHRLRQVGVADRHWFLVPLLFCSQPQIHEITHRSAIMSDEIAHEAVKNVVIKLSHAIPTSNIAVLNTLQNSDARAILRIARLEEAAMIRGIDIVTIPVRNQDTALKFYTEKLGFKVATNQYFGEGKQRWIELLIPGAESRLALFTPEGFENRIGGFQPVTFRCDDVYATAEGLKSRGVKLASEPKKEVWGTMAKFRDPDGNEFVFSSK